MDQDVAQSFKAVNDRFDELMEFLRDNMVMRSEFDGLKSSFEEFKLSVEENFTALRQEVRALDTRLDRLEELVQSLEHRTKEDVEAAVHEIFDIKRRVEMLEKALKIHQTA